MNTQTLIASVSVIAACTLGAYVVISPIARDAGTSLESAETAVLDVPSEVTSEDEQENDTNEREDDDRDNRAEEGDDRDVSENTTPSATPVVTPVIPVVPKVTPPPVVATPQPPVPEPVVPKSGYSLRDVAEHDSEASCWTAISGSVYDLTSYIPRHPGGERDILRICGKDGSSLFEREHGGESKAEARLASFRIGALIE